MTGTTIASAEDWPVDKCRTCGFADRWSEMLDKSAVLVCGNCGSMILTTKPDRERMLAASGRLALQYSLANMADEIRVAWEARRMTRASHDPAVLSEVRVRPIIFSGPMVRALLEGTKKQTRRIMKPPYGLYESTPSGQLIPIRRRFAVSDLLWVRESLRRHNGEKPEPTVQYVADTTGVPHHGLVPGSCDGRAYWRWKKNSIPSIHMPRWASRLTLKVTGVKVERVQDISREDEIAEGVEDGEFFDRLWSSIHGNESWQANPWVVAITFEVIKQNIDHLLANPEATP